MMTQDWLNKEIRPATTRDTNFVSAVKELRQEIKLMFGTDIGLKNAKDLTERVLEVAVGERAHISNGR